MKRTGIHLAGSVMAAAAIAICGCGGGQDQKKAIPPDQFAPPPTDDQMIKPGAPTTPIKTPSTTPPGVP